MALDHFDVRCTCPGYATKVPAGRFCSWASATSRTMAILRGADDNRGAGHGLEDQPARSRFSQPGSGRLHPGDLQFLKKVRKHYGIQLEVLSPTKTGSGGST